MDHNIIVSIAKDRILSDLCLKWYVETDNEQKKIIFQEIQITHNKLYIEEK